MNTQMMKESVQEDVTYRIKTALDAVESAMFSIVKSDVEVLRDASTHILQAGGKRVRPRLAMLVYMALGGEDIEYAAAPAAAIELMHTASVVHDDINDHGVLRRGRPSVNAIWGRTFALLTGDFLFTSVYELMSPYKDLNIVLAKAATALVEGETLQAHAVKTNTFTREAYARIIGLKTAALFQSAGEIGARLADATLEQVEAAKLYAFNIGMAFQIIDDILDIVGDEEKLGKTAGIDIEQGRGFVVAANDENGNNPNDIMESIKKKLMSGDYLQEARLQAKAFVSMAIGCLDAFPSSPYKDELISLAELVIKRDH